VVLKPPLGVLAFDGVIISKLPEPKMNEPEPERELNTTQKKRSVCYHIVAERELNTTQRPGDPPAHAPASLSFSRADHHRHCLTIYWLHQLRCVFL